MTHGVVVVEATQATDTLRSFLARIPDKYKEQLVLSAVYFWLKYQRRNCKQTEFIARCEQVQVPEDGRFTPEMSRLLLDAGKDKDGNAPYHIGVMLNTHPLKRFFFPTLTDGEISVLCSQLDEMFVNQQFCAECESWSYWTGKDDKPYSAEEFALYAGGSMLDLLKLGLVNLLVSLKAPFTLVDLLEGVLKERFGEAAPFRRLLPA